MSAPRVLLVEDDPSVRQLASRALGAEGFAVHRAAAGRSAGVAIARLSPSLLIASTSLPSSDILALRRIDSKGSPIPILFIAARDATDERMRHLTVGGDDYIKKPFSVEELMVRVRGVLRRREGRSESGYRVRVADLELDDDAHEVSRRGEVIPLSVTEYRLLRYLLANAGRVMTRAEIVDHVWDYDFAGDARVVETYIGYLRRKVDRAKPKLLHTIKGVGYVLRAPDTEQASSFVTGLPKAS